jgi:hypothetical protein
MIEAIAISGMDHGCRWRPAGVMRLRKRRPISLRRRPLLEQPHRRVLGLTRKGATFEEQADNRAERT